MFKTKRLFRAAARCVALVFCVAATAEAPTAIMCRVSPLDPLPIVSSGFGPRGDGWHAGVDFPAAVGTRVQAVGPGPVVRAAMHLTFGRVVIQRLGSGSRPGLGLYAVYAHLEAFAVRPGDVVAAGDTIGTVGSTGRSTGPHLHFSLLQDVPDGKVRWNGPIGVREYDYAIDPAQVEGCLTAQ